MADVLPALIDKQDAFEIVRDQVALILFENAAAQVVLATTAGKATPQDWALDVFTERSNPWELFTNQPQQVTPNQVPIINVWFESGGFDKSKGDPVKQQAHGVLINVDVYGWGLAADDGGTGQIPGDAQASENAQRATRLVRNILMSAENTYIQLQGLVWSRWVESITAFQPQLGAEAAHQIAGMRLSLRVECTETAQQVTGQALELINIDIFRDSDNKLVAEADYDFTP